MIIWGLGNENDWPGDFEDFDKDKIRAFMIELNDLAHALDSSRKTAIRRSTATGIRRCLFPIDLGRVVAAATLNTRVAQARNEEIKTTAHSGAGTATRPSLGKRRTSPGCIRSRAKRRGRRDSITC